MSEELAAETKKFFASRKLVFVMVDAPEDPHFTILPNVELVTSPKLAYLRAPGRMRGYIRERTVVGGSTQHTLQ